MGIVRNYFKQEFKSRMWNLQYDTLPKIYTCGFQSGLSPLPLLFIRGFVFLGGLSIILASIILTSLYGAGAYWPIYLTHWGLVFITVASGFGFAISCKVYINGSIDDTFGLPWYVKVYLISYNIAIPLAFFITIFYWLFLANAIEDFAVNFVLDIFIHAVNSVLVLILLVTAGHPTHILHFYFQIVLSCIYIIFTMIYYLAGGKDPFGNVFIYPVLDWSNPVPSVIVAIVSIVLVTVLHLIIVMLSLARDNLCHSCRKENEFNLAY